MSCAVQRLASLLALTCALACSDAPPTSASPDATAAIDAVAQPDAGSLAPDASADAAAAPDDAEPVDAGPTPDSGAYADAEVPCPRDDAGVCSLLTWTPTTAFPVAVDHHTTFVATSTSGAFLHVVGGVRNRQDMLEEVYRAVRRAPIASDGSLGAFEEVVSLPSPKAFHAMTIHAGFVYLLAGITADAQGAGASTEVLYGRIDGSGTVRSWLRGSRLPQVVRLHATASVLGNKLYLVGGSAQQVLGVVSVAEIAPDGSVGAWSTGPDLPAPRSHHAAVEWQGRIYLVGGFTTNQAEAPAILRSVNDDSGTITGWEEVGSMTSPPWTHGAFVRNDHVYVVGGGEGAGFFARYVDRVRRAPLRADGTMGEFEDVLSPLPRPRSHVHQAPYYLGRIYSIGGRRFSGLTSLAEQAVATFAQ